MPTQAPLRAPLPRPPPDAFSLFSGLPFLFLCIFTLFISQTSSYRLRLFLASSHQKKKKNSPLFKPLTFYFLSDNNKKKKKYCFSSTCLFNKSLLEV